MKILVDSNVILEVILQREEYCVANRLLLTLYQDKHDLLLTTGCFYGLLFTVDKYLRKEMKLVDPGRTKTLRSIMLKVLSFMNIVEHDKESLLRAVTDRNFTDLEDSCQHQAAVKADCDFLISFNMKDFLIGASMKVMTPQEFLDSYSTKW